MQALQQDHKCLKARWVMELYKKSTNGGETWVDVGNGNLAIQGDFTLAIIKINKDVYMYSATYMEPR